MSASSPDTNAGQRLAVAIGGILDLVHAIATADLPENIAAQANMPSDARREMERFVVMTEAEARLAAIAEVEAAVARIDATSAPSVVTGAIRLHIERAAVLAAIQAVRGTDQ